MWAGLLPTLALLAKQGGLPLVCRLLDRMWPRRFGLRLTVGAVEGSETCRNVCMGLHRAFSYVEWLAARTSVPEKSEQSLPPGIGLGFYRCHLAPFIAVPALFMSASTVIGIEEVGLSIGIVPFALVSLDPGVEKDRDFAPLSCDMLVRGAELDVSLKVPKYRCPIDSFGRIVARPSNPSGAGGFIIKD